MAWYCLDMQCKYEASLGRSFVSQQTYINGDSSQMKAAVNLQPLAVAVDASSDYWKTYTGGIISSPNCGTALNFAANIVGYGYTA